MAASLRLVLVGDVMLGRYVNDGFAFDARRRAQVWGDFLPWREALDPAATVTAGNLECASAWIGAARRSTPR